MKIPFEKWLEENRIPGEAMELFSESIICYKISAYRSAFIMSYIAFQNILKQRVLGASSIPTGIQPNWWETICSRLGDEDEWDKAIAECVNRTNPNRVFLISASIVSEYEAYRTVRNKCAHGKSGKIENYHIESFWNFIQENFYKFVVNGGKTGLMQQIENHYDRTITPLGTDVQPIVNNIMIGVQDTELSELLDDIYTFSEAKSSSFACQFTSRDSIIDLWDKLVNESDTRVHDAVLDFIMNKKQNDVCVFVGRYPSTASEFLSDSAFARKLWTGLLYECQYDDSGFWSFLEKIIHDKMVPDTEKDDFNKLLYKRIGKSIPTEHKQLLEETDYYSRLRKDIMTPASYGSSNGVNFANANCYYFAKFIKVFGLDKDSVTCINQIFSFATFGPFYDTIRSLMKQEDYLEQYKRIVSENGMGDYEEKLFTE